ncbi:MAG: apolipoprotein N-acyltransferase [Alphaproteobacteria bacterium]
MNHYIFANYILPYGKWWATILFGGLAGFAFVPWQIFWLFPLMMFFFIKNIFDKNFFYKKPIKIILAHGFLFYFLQNLVGLSWVGSAPLVFDQSLWWVGWLMRVMLPAIIALLYMPAFFIAKKFGTTHLKQLLLLGLGLSLIDILRHGFLSGSPWNIASHSFLYLNFFMPWVSLVGQYVLSFWLYGVIFLCAIGFYFNNHRPLVFSTVVLWCLIPMGLFYYLPHQPITSADTNQHIRVVQPNLSVGDKKQKPFFENIKRLKNLSHNQDTIPTIIIWPESAVPINFVKNIATRQFITDFMQTNDKLLLGGLRQDEDGAYRNSIFLLDSNGKILAYYDKHHLVPLGEYVPFASLAKQLGILPLAAQNINLARGDAPVPIKISDNFFFQPSICYEIIFPNLARRNNLTTDIDAIINISNDAWFGKTIGPKQHLFLARLRAVENGVPLYRSAITGISAVIDHRGHIVQNIDFGKADNIISPLLAKTTYPPFYARYQNIIDGSLAGGLALTLYCLCFISLPSRKKTKRKK